MTTQEIQRMVQAQPFTPFRIHVGDGKHYDVLSRESIAFTGKGRLISIGLADHFVTLNLLVVTAIEHPIPRKQPKLRKSA